MAKKDKASKEEVEAVDSEAGKAYMKRMLEKQSE